MEAYFRMGPPLGVANYKDHLLYSPILCYCIKKSKNEAPMLRYYYYYLCM